MVDGEESHVLGLPIQTSYDEGRWRGSAIGVLRYALYERGSPASRVHGGTFIARAP